MTAGEGDSIRAERNELEALRSRMGDAYSGARLRMQVDRMVPVEAWHDVRLHFPWRRSPRECLPDSSAHRKS